MSGQISAENSILFAKNAHQLLKDGKNEEALALCEEGVRHFPLYSSGHYILALCYAQLGQKEEAKSEYERTLTFDPSHARAMHKLYEHYLEAGLPQVAEEWLLKETLYNPLNEENINTLKERNLYDALRVVPSTTTKEIAEVTDSLVEEEASTESNSDLDALLEESSAMDALDPLAEELISDDEIAGEERPKTQDLSQFANTEDDFSTLMDGFFEEETEKETQTEDEWVEVENLLAEDDATLPVIEEEPEQQTTPAPQEETEILLENLSNLTEKRAEAQKQQTTHDENGDEENISATVSDVEEDITVRDLMDNPNIVTPTFGEILISQKRFSEAREIFTELQKKNPEDKRLANKLEFLDKFIDAQNAEQTA